MHLDETQVQGLLHGELARGDETAARAHLEACVACADRVDTASREEANVFALLSAVDHPPPRMSAHVIEARARAEDGRRWRWAAGIVLALGIGGVAYAAPGSPLPQLVRALVTWVRPGNDVAQTRSIAASSGAASMAGVALVPGEHLVIAFTSTQTRGEARVRLTDSAEVVVRAPNGAATFSSDVDRLVIDNRGGTGTFEIQIPRSAARVEIIVNGEGRFRVDRATVVDGPAASGNREYVIRLGSARN